MISGIFFISWRLAEVFTLIPTVGMLAWFVHGYTQANMLTPNAVLVLFIVSTLALAWAFFTLIDYARARRSGYFVAFVDLLFVGAFIAGVWYLRGITDANCSHFGSSRLYLNLGVFGNYGVSVNSPWAAHINKNCAMLKASFAFGIMNIIFFFITFFFALLVGRHHSRKEETVVVRRSSSHRGNRRSTSREYASSPRRSHQSHRSRRSYYV
ncbi:hypothetical protein NA57DRAFT_31508 [Rhizodiscina lignyota]|uniref:MARVEL domain-containing protein n=1 Tax=Rhizodiscina lignyota TaxID=1504668 RepID=A0A9P4IR39_9PEZI|nr:hypothetical protein NA57DRAFT_31508 [Rhizodiscina lignyota]